MEPKERLRARVQDATLAVLPEGLKVEITPRLVAIRRSPSAICLPVSSKPTRSDSRAGSRQESAPGQPGCYSVTAHGTGGHRRLWGQRKVLCGAGTRQAIESAGDPHGRHLLR